MEFVDRKKELERLQKSLSREKPQFIVVSDSLLRFHYHYVLPYRSLIELGNSQAVLNVFAKTENDYVGQAWEELCRRYVSTYGIDDIMFQMASRWWGSYYNEEKQQYVPVELDVVAESFDGKHLFLGECKWQEQIDAKEELARLQTIAKGLPFAEGHEVHYGLFLRKTPKHPESAKIFYPNNVLALL